MNNGSLIHNHDFFGEPDFVDPATDNYHIGSRSAAMDAGTDIGITTDIDGDARPAGAGYNIGADEYWYGVCLPLVLWNH